MPRFIALVVTRYSPHDVCSIGMPFSKLKSFPPALSSSSFSTNFAPIFRDQSYCASKSSSKSSFASSVVFSFVRKRFRTIGITFSIGLHPVCNVNVFASSTSFDIVPSRAFLDDTATPPRVVRLASSSAPFLVVFVRAAAPETTTTAATRRRIVIAVVVKVARPFFFVPTK